VTGAPVRVLVLGGLDPSGGAGLTADARTLFRCAALALPVATALTVQNRSGMRAVNPTPSDLIARSFAAAVDDGPVDAVKVGLLAAADQVRLVHDLLVRLRGRVPIVVDPVLSATAGGFEPGRGLAAALAERLVPLATVLTPNLPELELLAGALGAPALLGRGCGAILVKGGHGTAAEVRDELFTTGGIRAFEHARLPVGPVHGTGCALASALAAGLAHGVPLEAACEQAVRLVQQALRAMGVAAKGGLPRPLWLPAG
jgi:hydroxymethylpyrimidine/phosphomethylpyrimidine kinase